MVNTIGDEGFLKKILPNVELKICTNNFQLGDLKIDIIGVDSNLNLCFVFIYQRDFEDNTKLGEELTSINQKITGLYPFFDAFQILLKIRIFFITPKKSMNVDTLYFQPKKAFNVQNYYLRQKPKLSNYFDILNIITPENLSKERLSHQKLYELTHKNIKKIFPLIFGEKAAFIYSMKLDYLIENSEGTWPADIVLIWGQKNNKIIEVESPLPMDPFLRDKRVEDIINEIKIYSKEVDASNVAIVTQKQELEIKKICDQMGVIYLSLEGKNIF